VAGIAAFARGADAGRDDAEPRLLMDDCRKGRESGGFTPKGDGLLGGGGS
jgi:hypothetical protein